MVVGEIREVNRGSILLVGNLLDVHTRGPARGTVERAEADVKLSY